MGVHILASIISRPDKQFDFFIWGFVKDDVQILPLLIALNEMKDKIRV